MTVTPVKRAEQILRQLLPWFLRLMVFLLAVLAVSQPTLLFPVQAVQHADFGAALFAHPDDPAVLKAWYSAAQNTGQTEQAAVLVRRIVDLGAAARDDTGKPTDAQTVRDTALESMAARDWLGALAAYRRLVALQPADMEAHYQLGLLLAPTEPHQALVELGMAASDPRTSQRASAASRILTRGVDVPVSSQLAELALQLTANSEWPAAEYILNRLAALDGGSPLALALMGLAQDEQGRDGANLLLLALARAPRDPTVNYAEALHWRLAGDLDRALVTLQRAFEVNPRSPVLAAEMGTVYRLKSLPEEAARWYEQAVQLAPQDRGFQAMTAEFYADEGFRLDTLGLAAIQRALANFPNDAEINAIDGQALLSLGQRAEAQTQLDRALSLEPGNIRAHFYRAQLLEQTGRAPDALPEYRYVYANANDDHFHPLAARAIERLTGSSAP